MDVLKWAVFRIARVLGFGGAIARTVSASAAAVPRSMCSGRDIWVLNFFVYRGICVRWHGLRTFIRIAEFLYTSKSRKQLFRRV